MWLFAGGANFIFSKCVHAYSDGEIFWYTIPWTVSYRTDSLIYLSFFRVQEEKDEARCPFCIFCNSIYRVKLEERVV